MKDINNFIDIFKEIESKNINKKFHLNVYDKYINGHCEDLVMYLYLFNDYQGEKLKVIGLCQFDEEWDETVIHYVYKLDNKYYDIYGEFNDLETLMDNAFLVDSIESTEIIKIDNILHKSILNTLSNINVYIETLNSIENDYDLER